jgi:hypothetical protein
MCRSLGVFAGPSLPVADRVERCGITYRAPAARGDIEAAADGGDMILLIDGAFHHDLAPSPREVVDACDRVRMLGAASMGALRAAECAPFGMLGLGAIAGWYARGLIDGDDEVAVAMHPRTHRALSVPSVNVRYVAWLARRRGILTPDVADAWIERARTQIFYAERSWSAALSYAPQPRRPALAALAYAHGDLKRWDARFALRRALRLVDRGRADV